MDPEGEYESRHSTSAHVNTQEEEKGEEVYDGPTAPPLSLAGMEPNIDPSPNQKGGQDEMPLPPVATDKLAPPDETVSQSVAIPIGLDTVDAKLPEARVIPIVTDASNGSVEITNMSTSVQRHGDAKIPAQSVACLKHKKLIYLVVVMAVLAFIGMAIGVAVMATKPEPGPPQPAEQTEGPTPPPTTKDYIPTVSPTQASTPVPAPTKAHVGPTMFDAIATEEPTDNPTDALSTTDVPSSFPTIDIEVAPEPEPSPAPTTASPTLAPTFEPSPFPTPEREIREREIGCIESNGVIVTDSCCQDALNFPNTCRASTCECNDKDSVATQLCICEEGECFNGSQCQADFITPEPTPFPTVQSDNNPNCEVDFDTCVECLGSGFCAYSPDTGRYGSCLNSCDDAVADGRCFEKGGDSDICAIIDTEEPTESPTDAPTIFFEPTESPTVFRMACKPCDRKVEVEVCLRTDDWPLHVESSLYIENEDGETKLEMRDFRQSRKMICRTKRLCPKKHWLFVEDDNCDGTGNPSGKIIISTRKGEVFKKTLHNFGCTYEKSFDVPDIQPCP